MVIHALCKIEAAAWSMKVVCRMFVEMITLQGLLLCENYRDAVKAALLCVQVQGTKLLCLPVISSTLSHSTPWTDRLYSKSIQKNDKTYKLRFSADILRECLP